MSFDWLVARPIAHRGRHDAARGIVENSIAAADAAVAEGCAIECDVQVSSDGEAFVFHDETFDRQAGLSGDIRATSAAAIARLRLTGAAGPAAIPSLEAFLERIGGRTSLIVEIKSRFDGDMRLADRTARLATQYAGQIALKSFDPAILAHLRRGGLSGVIPLGLVLEARFDDPEWDFLPPDAKESMASLLHWRETRPDFLSFHVRDLPHGAISLARMALRMPVMTWTVRTPAQWETARRFADQAVFEGPLPSARPSAAGC